MSDRFESVRDFMEALVLENPAAKVEATVRDHCWAREVRKLRAEVESREKDLVRADLGQPPTNEGELLKRFDEGVSAGLYPGGEPPTKFAGVKPTYADQPQWIVKRRRERGEVVTSDDKHWVSMLETKVEAEARDKAAELADQGLAVLLERWG